MFNRNCRLRLAFPYLREGVHSVGSSNEGGDSPAVQLHAGDVQGLRWGALWGAPRYRTFGVHVRLSRHT